MKAKEPKSGLMFVAQLIAGFFECLILTTSLWAIAAASGVMKMPGGGGVDLSSSH